MSPSKLIKAIAIILLTLIVLFGIVVLTIWLTIKPRRLVYSIEDGSTQNFNISKYHLNSSFDFVIRAYNPNTKVSIYYNKFEVSVKYEDQTMAFGNLSDFFQPCENVTHLEVNLVGRDVLMSGPVARDLELEKSSGEVGVEVKIKARVKYKVGGWKSNKRKLRVNCAPVFVYMSSSNEIKRTLCDVNF